MSTDPKKKPTKLERFARAAYEEMPRAAYSGLTTGLIANAQPRNAMVDRRIHQPPLASMNAMNPEGDPGIIDAIRDLASDPRRMLPGSGGWTEGMGAALPHTAAAAIDFVNPAAWASRAAGPVARTATPMVNRPQATPVVNAMMHPPGIPPRGSINPHFAPTGKVRSLTTRGIAHPTVSDPLANRYLTEFASALESGDKVKMNRLWERLDRSTASQYLFPKEQLNQLDLVHDYISAVLEARVKATRHAPGVRSSNSNAPVISGNAQPDPYAPTLGGKRGPQ